MKAKIFMLLLAVLLSGCGAFRKVFKSKEYSNVETKTEVRKDSIGMITDKSTTTIKEVIDTTVIVPGKVVEQETDFNLDSLINGITAIKSEFVDVSLLLNPKTGKLTAKAVIKPASVPVKLHRETVKQNDITQWSNSSELWKNSFKQNTGSSIVEKEPINIPYWVYLGLLIFVLLAIWYWAKNK